MSNLAGYSKIVVEIESVSRVTHQHRAQVHNDHERAGQRLSRLVNFVGLANLAHRAVSVGRPSHS